MAYSRSGYRRPSSAVLPFQIKPLQLFPGVSALRTGVVVLAVMALFRAPAGAADVDIVPLDEVREGMVGLGYTVFRGGRIETFTVEVLGVMVNSAPRRNTILARLEGGPLAESGVIAGMSGSPVYVDGRLLGAVSSGYLYSKQPIAGITPIEEMLSIPSKSWSPDASHALRLATPAAVGAHLLAIENGRPPSPLASFTAARSVAAGPASPMIPVMIAGLEPRALTKAFGFFEAFGLTPVQAAGVARSRDDVGDELVPGSPVAVELIRGDLNIAAYGTVTARDGDQILAFGHPLFNVGSVDFPIASAGVITVLPSIASSFKISTLGKTVGALRQDRSAGVLGEIGAIAPMIPVRLGLKNGDNPMQDFVFELASHRLLSPVLVEISLLNTLQASEKLVGASTVSLSGQIEIDGHDDIVLDHFFSGDAAAPSMASLVASITQILLDNPFSPATVDGITLIVDYHEGSRYALLDRVWTDKRQVRPGEEVLVKAFLSRIGAADEVVEMRVRVPEATPKGAIELIIGDASSMVAFEARTQRYVPRTLDQLIDLINGLRKSSSLYAMLSRPDHGVAVNGVKMTRLPPSAYSLIVGGDAGNMLLPIRQARLAEIAAPSRSQVSGFKKVRLEVLESQR